MSDRACENPFCTRRIRPGAIPFLFPAGQDTETLVERLRQNGWRGEIVGAHGSGKSALLATLVPAIKREGQDAAVVELHEGQRRLPPDFDREHRFGKSMVLIVDGFEQLSRWRRWLLRRLCRRRGCGLLVTAHASVGLPPLYETAATPEVAETIVSYLMGGKPAPLGTPELAECLALRGGDLRETLFHLYDLFEESRCVREKTGAHRLGTDK